MGREKITFAIFLCIFLGVNLILISESVFAAKIQGELFSPDFEELTNVIVKINTTPLQQEIVKNGTYSFFVNQGNYLIEASSLKDSIKYSAKETISVKSEGEYTLDIMLFPESEEFAQYPEVNFSEGENEIDLIKNYVNFSKKAEESSLNASALDLQKNQKSSMNYSLIVGSMFFLILVSIVFFLIYLTMRKIKNIEMDSYKKNSKGAANAAADEKDADDYYEILLNSIKKEKRTTQKELRKLVPLSEAKVSLIITELEQKGLIKKIKKGRGNVIVWNK